MKIRLNGDDYIKYTLSREIHVEDSRWKRRNATRVFPLYQLPAISLHLRVLIFRLRSIIRYDDRGDLFRRPRDSPLATFFFFLFFFLLAETVPVVRKDDRYPGRGRERERDLQESCKCKGSRVKRTRVAMQIARYSNSYASANEKTRREKRTEQSGAKEKRETVCVCVCVRLYIYI